MGYTISVISRNILSSTSVSEGTTIIMQIQCIRCQIGGPSLESRTQGAVWPIGSVRRIRGLFFRSLHPELFEEYRKVAKSSSEVRHTKRGRVLSADSASHKSHDRRAHGFLGLTTYPRIKRSTREMWPEPFLESATPVEVTSENTEESRKPKLSPPEIG